MRIKAVWFVPLVALIALAAFLGLRMGQPLTETQAITFYAGQYAEATGGSAGDCSAIPSLRDGIWIEVVCIGADKTGVLYLVAPNGQLDGTITIKAPDA